MSGEVAEGALLFLPLFLGFVLHGLCIRFGLLRGLTVPIDRGATLGGRRLFGDSKTYRGLACVALGTALGFGLLSALGDHSDFPHLDRLPSAGPASLLGLGVGVAAMLAELPNSAVKRRLGISPGSQARGIRGVVFHVLDQIDVLFGAWPVLATRVPPSAALVLGSVGFVYLGHQLITVVGYCLGMRAKAR